MPLLSSADWQEYLDQLSAFNEEFASCEVIWRRYQGTNNRFNEDPQESPNGRYTDVVLKVLKNDNYMRTWPITKTSETGEIEDTSVQLYIFLPMLKSLGYAIGNQMQVNPGYDRFIIDGLVYKIAGRTPTAQAGNQNAWYTLICRQEEPQNGL